MANKIGIVLALDGEKEFTAAVQSAQKEVRMFQSELKGLSKDFEGEANSMVYLTKKQEVLTKQQEAYQRKLDAAKSGYEKANNSYRAMGDNLKKLREDLNKAKDALKDMDEGTEAYEKQTKKVKELEEAVEKQAVAHARESGSVADWTKRVNESQRALNKSNDELKQNEKYLDEARNASDHCATSIDKMGNKAADAAKDVDKVGDEAKDTASELESAGKKSSTFGDMLKANLAADVIVNGVKAIGETAKEAAEFVIDVGSSFEAAMSEVQAISGASGEDLDALSEKAKELGASTKFSATEAAEAFKYMSLAGWDTKSMLSGIDGVMSLAAASGMDLAQASDMVTDYLSAFGLEASESTKIADMLAFAQANSSTTAEQLGEAYGNCAANMHAAGQDIETTTSFLEAFANQGIKGSEAGTKMSAIMRDITAKMKDGKIAIGDTNVEVTDANGNFRDLTDIMTDVEAATQGMGDAERAAALSATFTSRSVGGLNMILTEGMENVSGYETALRNAGGAADEAATIMQDNLSGDLTTMNSALEGLGIAAYEYIDGPVRGVVQGVTGIISGLTDVITPQEEELSTFSQYVQDISKEIQESNEATKKAVDEAKDTFDAATMDSNEIEMLSSRLMELNSVEQLTTTQKAEMQAIVAELSKSIPELSGAYDDENGKLNKTNEELEALVKNYQNAAIAQAATAATQELVNAQMEATVNKVKAESLREMLENEIDVWDAEAKLYQRMVESGDYSNENYRTEALKLWKEALDEGKISLDQYNEAVDNINTSNMDQRMSSMESSVGELTDGIEEQNLAIKDSENVIEDCDEEIGVITKAQKEMASEAAAATSKINGLSDAMGRGMPTDVAEKMAGAMQETADAADDAADALEEEGEVAETTAEKVKTGAETQKEAMQGVLDTYRGYVDEIEADLQDKINPFEKFDTETGFGEDVTVEQMTENLNSQIEAFETYQNKLAAVKEHVGKEIAPEFMQYIESMGVEGTNMLDHILRTFEDKEPEKVRALSDAWCKNMDMTEGMAKVGAANKMAFEAEMGKLGSTPVEFSALRESIEAAKEDAIGEWSNLSEETAAALEGMVQTAQECGIKIPEGLAEGISNGKISPEQAAEQLNGALQGSLAGLAQIAREAGLSVDENITAGIESGDAESMKAAYDQLIAYIATNADPAVLSQIFDEASADSAAAIGAHAGDAETEGGNLAQAAADGASDKQSEFQAAGTESAGKYVAALEAYVSQSASAGGALASAAYNAATSWSGAFYSAGVNMSAGIAQGIRDGGSGIVRAMVEQIQAAERAGKNAAQIASPSKKFRKEIGQQIGNGVAFGIRDKASLAGDAAAKMSAAVYNKASNWLKKYKKNQQVSVADEKYYWDQVLQHVKKGTAAYNNAIKKLAVATFSGTGLSTSSATAALKKIESNFGVARTKTTGSGKNKKTVKKDAESYYSEIYNAANKYLSNMQTLNDWSLQAEMEYWKSVQAQLKKGTQGWYDAQKEINSLNAAIAEEKVAANDRIVSSAEDYIRKQEILNGMSDSAELQYWESVIKKIESGTDAWYDAKEHINELKSQIAEDSARAAEELAKAAEDAAAEAREAVENEAKDAEEAAREALQTHLTVQQQLLAKYKTYYDVSAKAEMDYWDIARKQFQEGTEERIEADQAYFDAREAYYDKIAELDEDYAEKKQSIDDELADSIKSLQDAYDDAVKSREQEIRSSMNLFESWDAEGWDSDKLMENLRTQVDGLQFWEQQLDELAGKGVSQELMDELAEMGPDAAANLWSLNQMTAEQLDEYQALWTEKNSLAHKQALEDNEDLLKETQDAIADARKTAQDQILQMEEDYRKEIAVLNVDLAGGLKGLVDQAGNIGEDMVSKLVSAVKNGTPDIANAVEELHKEIASMQEEVWRQAEEAAKKAAEKARQETQAAQQALADQTTAQQTAAAQTAVAEQQAAQQRTAAEAASNERIKKIINAGTTRSKTLTASDKKRGQSELAEYIITKYGRWPTTAMYQQLAAELGVNLSKTITNGQRDAILKALKKRGFAQGARGLLEDELAWLLENQKTEYVVRTADNAILQPMRAGDKVINPQGAENLYDFAADPTRFITGRAQAAFAAAQEDMLKQSEIFTRIPELSYGGIARLNRLIEQGSQSESVVNVDNSGLVPLMQQMVSGLRDIIGQVQDLQNRQFVLDTGTLVGELQQPMSRANGIAQRRRNRGTLR